MVRRLRRFSYRALPLVAAFVFAVPVAVAEARAGSASGRFQTPGATLEIKGAYSFWFKSASPVGKDAVIRVAVANGQIDRDYFDGFYDRLRAINERFVEDDYRVVYFEFTADGKYHGVSYYFGSGDGCGYCFDDTVKSTVHLGDGRLKGRLTSQEKKRSFDVEIDVPVPGKEWGEALGKEREALAKAYLAWQTALETRNVKSARAASDAKLKAFWARLEQDGKLNGYLDYCWTEKHLEMRKPEITGGFVRGDRAVLLVKGQGAAAIGGEALLRREGGAWLYSDELLAAD